jgi:hypothetical protein
VVKEIEDAERELRSYGCNGPNNRDEHRCRLHCRSEGYKTGFCSAFTNYRDCVCFKSSVDPVMSNDLKKKPGKTKPGKKMPKKKISKENNLDKKQS